jgi:methyltransferase of ATP-grasp peptide maturase system
MTAAHAADTAALRRGLADRLEATGALRSPAWRAAVEQVPRQRFLLPGVFTAAEDGAWQPVTPEQVGAQAWLELAYTDESLVTQLDGSTVAAEVSQPVPGSPTSSSTMPGLVVRMLEDLDIADGHQVLEIGTGSGYSTALLCARLGEDNVTSVEVDPGVAARADAALEDCGYSTWTVTGDGLLGYPPRAPYDRIIATCAVRRVPHTWVRQTRPGGLILATVGSWSYGTGLAKLTVQDDGAASGTFLPGTVSFMHARAHHITPPSGDLAARAAYPDTERPTRVAPDVLDQWMPAFLAQLAAPAAQLVRAISDKGDSRVYLFDTSRESFAAFDPPSVKGADEAFTVCQGGPVALWDDIEDAITTWRAAGSPGIEAFDIRVTRAEQAVWLDTPQGRACWLTWSSGANR